MPLDNHLQGIDIELNSIQNEISDAVAFFTSDKKIMEHLDGFLATVASKQALLRRDNDAATQFGKFTTIISSSDFWMLLLHALFLHPLRVHTLIKCVISDQYKAELQSPNLNASMAHDENIQKFMIWLADNERQTQLDAVLDYFLNLPDRSQSGLDKQVIRDILNIVGNEPILLVSFVPRLYLDFAKLKISENALQKAIKDNKKDVIAQRRLEVRKNYLEIIKTALEVASTMNGIDKVTVKEIIRGKTDFIKNCAVNNDQNINALLNNSMHELLAMITQEQVFEKALEHVNKVVDMMLQEKPMMEIVSECLEAAALLKDDLPQIIEKNKNVITNIIADNVSINGVQPVDQVAASAITTVLKQNYAEAVKQVSNIVGVINDDTIKLEDKNVAIAHAVATASCSVLQPQIAQIVQEAGVPTILALCFEPDLDKSHNNNVVYKLSALGLNMAEFGLLQLKDISAAEPLKNKETAKAFRVEVAGRVEIKDEQKNVTVSRDDFVNNLGNKLNIEFLQLLPAVVKTPQTVEALSHVIGAFRNNLSMFGWIANGIDAVVKNPELREKLYEQRDALVAMLQLTPLVAKMQEFGLDESFLEIAKHALKDDASVKILHEIVANMGAENYGLMMQNLAILVSKNEELREFINEPKITQQVGALVQKLSGNVDVMKKFLEREDFKAIKDNMPVLAEQALPTLLQMLNNESSLQLFNGLELNIRCGNIVNGFMMLPCMTKITDKVQAEKLSRELYKLLVSNDGVLPVHNVDSDFITNLGIEDIVEFKRALHEAELNALGLELRNRTDLIFKVEVFPEKQAMQQAIINKQNTERETAFNIIRNISKVDVSSELDEGLFGDDQEENKRIFYEIVDNNIAKSQGEFATEFDNAVHGNTLSSDNAFKLKVLYTDFHVKVAEVNKKYGINTPVNHLCTRVSHEEIMFNMMHFAVSNNIHSDAIYSVGEYIKSIHHDNVLCNEDVVAILKTSPVFASIDNAQLEQFAMLLMANKEQINDTALGDRIKEIGCRKRGAEGIGDIQDLLIATFAPLAAMIGDDQQRDNTIATFNKLIVNIQKNPLMMDALNRVILEKGTPASQVNIIIETIGEIFTEDGKYTQEDKQILKTALIGILKQMPIPPAVYNTIEEVVDVCIADPANAKKLYNNGTVLKDVLANILSGNGVRGTLAAVWLQPQELLGALGGILGAGVIGPAMRNFRGKAIVQDDQQTQAALNAIHQAQGKDGNKVNVLAILRKDFSSSGNFIFAGQTLNGSVVAQDIDDVVNIATQMLNLSTCVFENTQFYKTTIKNVDFSNSDFKKSDFAEVKFDGKTKFNGATFDVQSFKSLIEAFEKNGLSPDEIMETIADAKVYDTTYLPTDAISIYSLMVYERALQGKEENAQGTIPNEWIINLPHCAEAIKYCQLFASSNGNALAKLFNKAALQDLPNAFAEKGLEFEAVKRYTHMSLSEALYQYISGNEHINANDSNEEIELSKALQQYYVGKVIDSNDNDTIGKLKQLNNMMPISSEVDGAITKIMNVAFGQYQIAWHADDIYTLLKTYTDAVKDKADIDHDLLTEYIAGVVHDGGRSHNWVMNDHLIPAEVEKMISNGVKVTSNPNYQQLFKIAQAVVKTRTEKPIYTQWQVVDAFDAMDNDKQMQLIELFEKYPEYTIGNHDNAGLADTDINKYSDEIAIIHTVASNTNFDKLIEIADAVIEARAKMNIKSVYTKWHVVDMLSALGVDTQNTLIQLFNTQKEYIIGNEFHPGLADVEVDFDIVIDTADASSDMSDVVDTTARSIARRYANPEQSKELPKDGTVKKCAGFMLDVFAMMSAEDRKLIAEIHEANPLCLANLIFVKLMDLEGQKPSLTMHQQNCVGSVKDELTAMLGTIRSNGITNMSEYVKECFKQAQSIAEKVFNNFAIAELWNDKCRCNRSIENLTNTVAIGLLRSGRTFSGDEINKLVGDGKAIYGRLSNDFSRCSGLTKEYKDIYYSSKAATNAQAWYDVGVYDKKDNHTQRLLKGVENQINSLGNNQQSNISMQL